MTTRQMELLAPLANPLPDLPPGDPFTGEQWKILMAIMDTIIPSIRREATTNNKVDQLTVSDVQYNTAVDHLKNTVVNPPTGEYLDEYLDERPSANPGFQSLLKRYLGQYAPDDAKKGLSFILSTLKYVQNISNGSAVRSQSQTYVQELTFLQHSSWIETSYRIHYSPPRTANCNSSDNPRQLARLLSTSPKCHTQTNELCRQEPVA
jgi:hypothetical protein